jgi:spore photoproduct lyase
MSKKKEMVEMTITYCDWCKEKICDDSYISIRKATKTLVTKPNNNSANCIAPNLVYGCFGGCIDTYCYMSRYNGHRVFVNENVDDIFNSVVEWEKTFTKEPDQQDPIYTMVDIACNTDLVLMQKHLPEPLIDYLKRYDDHPQLNTTMATKYPNLLNLDVRDFNKSPRVRVSLMPQKFADILEPKMQKIESRIHEINRLKDLGWEVHINYSPLVFTHGWKDEYRDLFEAVKDYQMEKASPEAQELMKYSCEVKNNSGVMRYPLKWKTGWLNEFKKEYEKFFPLDTIRYIF